MVLPDEQGTSLCSRQFKRYTFDNVFRYDYVGVDLAKHGGVKVTYKDRLSRRGSYLDAEYAPAMETTDKEGRTRNTTTDDGILFVNRPPDLRRDAPRESFSDKHADKPTAAIKSLLKAWKPELEGKATASWEALQALHALSPIHSGQVPDMPHQPEGFSTEFKGSPMALKDILKGLQRLDRPLITWRIWDEAPPSTFPSTPLSSTSAGATCHASDPAAAVDARRDVRTVNRVLHGGFSAGEFNKVMTDVSNEEWLAEQENRLEVEHWAERDQGGGLYVVQLEHTEPDGEFCLGVGRDLGPGATSSSRLLRWFARSSKVHTWPGAVKFKPFNSEDNLDLESFLLHIDEDTKDGDVCPSSKPDCPYLNSGFMARLRLFAARDSSLLAPQAAVPARARQNPAEKRRATDSISGEDTPGGGSVGNSSVTGPQSRTICCC